jgi:DNA-binding SARP family transcriptional activator
LQLHGLYRGHFLGDGDLPAWALPQRDRLRARYVRCAELLGARLENLGRLDDAIALYRTALEHDNLAEELYQRLIGCHLARGEAAQALNAYRRCRELLSVVLGLRPSARTEALAARIAGR